MRVWMVLLSFLFTTQAFGAASLTPAFSKFSSVGMAIDAGKQGTNTLQVIGATLSKSGGKPTMTITKDKISVENFGAKGDYYLADGVTVNPSPTNNTAAFAAAVAYALSFSAMNLPEIYIPEGAYYVPGGIVIKKKFPLYNAPLPQLVITGTSGRKNQAYAGGGSTIVKGANSGPIIQINEEPYAYTKSYNHSAFGSYSGARYVSGEYPGGGDGVVTTPLAWLHSVKIKGLNLVGDRTNTAYVDGIVGRGISYSQIEDVNIQGVNYGVRFGIAEAATTETSADGTTLDYTEQNTFRNVTITDFETGISLGSTSDNTVFENGAISFGKSATSRLGRIYGANGGVIFRNNLLHPSTNPYEANPGVFHTGFEMYFSSAEFSNNHIENVGAVFATGSTAEHFRFRDNTMYFDNHSFTSAVFNLSGNFVNSSFSFTDNQVYDLGNDLALNLNYSTGGGTRTNAGTVHFIEHDNFVTNSKDIGTAYKFAVAGTTPADVNGGSAYRTSLNMYQLNAANLYDFVLGYAGDMLNFKVHGTSRYRIDNVGQVTQDAPAGTTGNIHNWKLAGAFVAGVSAAGAGTFAALYSPSYNAAADTQMGLGNNTVTTANRANIRADLTNNSPSGVSPGVVLNLDVSQSGTAGYQGLRVNVTETTTGSGAKQLISAGLGGLEKFAVSSTGVVNAGGGSANTAVCWKSDGHTLGYATVAEITAGTCH